MSKRKTVNNMEQIIGKLIQVRVLPDNVPRLKTAIIAECKQYGSLITKVNHKYELLILNMYQVGG